MFKAELAALQDSEEQLVLINPNSRATAWASSRHSTATWRGRTLTIVPPPVYLPFKFTCRSEVAVRILNDANCDGGWVDKKLIESHLLYIQFRPVSVEVGSGKLRLVLSRLFSVEWKLLTQKSDSFWFLNQRSEWMPWALKNHSKIWFGLNPFDSFWFIQPNDLPDDSSDMCHSQILVWESKGINYSTDDSFIHGESNNWVNDSELKTA